MKSGKMKLPMHLDKTFKEIRDLYIFDVYSTAKSFGLIINYDTIILQIKHIKNIIHSDILDTITLEKSQYLQYLNELRYYLMWLMKVKNEVVFAPQKDEIEIINEFNKLNQFPISKVNISENHEPMLDTSVGPKVMTALNQFFPEMQNAIAGNILSFEAQLWNFSEFEKRISRIVIGDHIGYAQLHYNDPISKWFPSGYTKMNGNSKVGNFAPTVAKWIYLNEIRRLVSSGKNSFIFADTSLGWSGRLLGLMSSLSQDTIHREVEILLVGTDVNKSISNRYQTVHEFWLKHINPFLKLSLKTYTEAAEELFNIEDFRNIKGKVDFVLTSPPYFNKEIYSTDDKQSSKRYPEYGDWIDGFLRPMINNVYDLLKHGARFYLNIADVKNRTHGYYPLENDTLQIAEQAGFKLKAPIKMLFPVNQGPKQSNGVNYSNPDKLLAEFNKNKKFENIFVLEK